MEMTMEAIVWLVLLVLFLILEAGTLGLTTIWFAGGALAACILAVFGANIWVQLIVFCAVSIVLLVIMRPFASKWINRGRVKTNVDGLIGETAVVTESIENLTGKGQVQIRGQYWSARTDEESAQIPVGTQVEILRIDGVKLIVKAK